MPVHSPRPVRSAAEAVSLLKVVVTRPLASETICVPLDPDGFGHLITRVTDTTSPDSLEPILQLITHTMVRADVGYTELFVAAVRPRGGLVPGDIDRWLEASDLCAERGIRLIEWFIVGPRGALCPRDLLGEPERWNQPSSGGAPWAESRCARR